MEKYFAAFVMTYERPLVLKETLNKLLNQTSPPQKILVVDNSDSFETKNMIELWKHPQIFYYRVGYNSGPAGAAKIGLTFLVKEGFKWIYWGDDDDPPAFINSFEILLRLVSQHGESIGIIGGVGQYFNKRTGNILRVKDNELKINSLLDVDVVAGGQTLIVNAGVVKQGILPNEKLFFGFEELDFCIKVKKGGYKIWVPSELFLRSRKLHNRINYKPPVLVKNNSRNWRRQYFSIRNMFSICIVNKYYSALLYQVTKNLFKSLYGFRYGLKYGVGNAKSIYSGIFDGFAGKFGRV